MNLTWWGGGHSNLTMEGTNEDEPITELWKNKTKTKKNLSGYCFFMLSPGNRKRRGSALLLQLSYKVYFHFLQPNWYNIYIIFVTCSHSHSKIPKAELHPKGYVPLVCILPPSSLTIGSFWGGGCERVPGFDR